MHLRRRSFDVRRQFCEQKKLNIKGGIFKSVVIFKKQWYETTTEKKQKPEPCCGSLCLWKMKSVAFGSYK